MGISENFLVNPKSFDPIIEALVSRSEDPEKISDELLEDMGFDNPSDLLVIHVLRGMEIINQDRTPTDLYYLMVNTKKTKDAIAEGVLNGYHELFERNYDVHKMLPGEIKEELTTYFDGKKTDLIIKYLADTFQKLVAFTGFQKIEQARDNYFKITRGISADTEKNTPGNDFSYQKTDETDNPDQDNSRSVEDVLFGDDKTQKNKENIKGNEIDNRDHSLKRENDEAEQHKSGGNSDKTTNKPSDSSFSSKPEQNTASLPKLDTANKRVQKAIIRRAELQYRLEYFKEALASAEKIITYFDDSEQESLKNAVSNAIIRRVDLLKKLDMNQQLLPALNEVINRFSESDKERYYKQASEALLDKAKIFEENDLERKSLLPLYDAIVHRLKNETDPSTKNQVNEIYVKRLGLLISSDNRSELLNALNEFIDRFEKSPQHRKYLEEAMFRKAELLETMSHSEEALEAYSSFLKEFSNKEDL